jgi:hypothetical protein
VYGEKLLSAAGGVFVAYDLVRFHPPKNPMIHQSLNSRLRLLQQLAYLLVSLNQPKPRLKNIVAGDFMDAIFPQRGHIVPTWAQPNLLEVDRLAAP